MDSSLDKQLKTLRLQNQALLLQLRQGQQDCSQVIHSLTNTDQDKGSNTAVPANVPNKDNEKSYVKIVRPNYETLKARDCLKAKHKRLVQGLETDPLCNTKNPMMDDPQPKLSIVSKPETPKSILKRRKIVDDNVKVDSKFAHTPPYKAVPKSKQLNFSYADVDDLEMAKARFQKNGDMYTTSDMSADDVSLNGSLSKAGFQKNGDMNSVDVSLDGSYLGNSETQKERDTKVSEPSKLNGVSSVENLVRDRLLLDAGNDRKHAAIVDALKKRPKSILFEETTKQGKQTKNQSLKGRSFNLDQSITKEMSNLLDSRTVDRPLLGYDWIAGLLDNGPVLSEKPKEYFDTIKDFRRQNRDECVRRGGLENILDLTKPVEPEVQNPSHTCVHGFILNERLFPEAMNPDEDGKNVCPVCLSTRPEPTKEDPGFVRVSIPRSTLLSPYRVKPHRRRSFDSTDSISLANHCMAGYECSKPSALPTASNLDLKNLSYGIKAKLSVNESELGRLAQSFSHTSRTLNELQSLSRLNSTTSSDIQTHQTTDDLLNTSHALRYELQKIEKDRHLKKPAPNSTAYPTF